MLFAITRTQLEMEHQNRQALGKKGRIGQTPTDLGVPALRERHHGDTVVIADMPNACATKEEIGLLRAFLQSEINAILNDDDGE
ncbi:hypothetical protein KKP04_12405 [Rhodomicrobium sp. Az07]|uniref:hypothetical protein n=1 Tax=Rhodomicrobium sp. Az07 TaxID=2839034 RepID=UPI001BEB21B3|nr:hypothetical protein [Rhodomicrobium sp. Az07]MBT3071665.1 hypothetical protein [Rhodomicrobium sp. Az07]